jgi:Rrf2 family transcriptional regulator, nitric oxide-sensitive transcriptional repressor
LDYFASEFMQLTIFTDYGLRSLMYLAANPEKIHSVRKIAEHYGISRNHLVKVVHRLSQLGYIESTKGKGGGIKIAHNASELRIGDIVQKLEPNMNIVECFDQAKNTCKVVSYCSLKHYLKEANIEFIKELNKHTLADTVKDKNLFL